MRFDGYKPIEFDDDTVQLEKKALEETKYKLKLGKSKSSSDVSLSTSKNVETDAGSDLNFGSPKNNSSQPSSDNSNEKSDMPFDKEPFDAGVDADEETDPKKFIQQLSGKLGQSLRKYTDEQGNPDFELEKFAVNSVLSATHTGDMDSKDQADIIKKVKKSGKNDEPATDTDNLDGDESGVDLSLDDSNKKSSTNNTEDDEVKENLVSENMIGDDELTDVNILKAIKQLIKKDLSNTQNSGNFVEKEPITSEAEPIVKPQPIEKPVEPSRRSKPFKPNRKGHLKPKANSEQSNLIHEDGDMKENQIVKVNKANEHTIVLDVYFKGEIVQIDFERDSVLEKPMEYDEPWVYLFKSTNAPDKREYEIAAEFIGHPEANLDFQALQDEYIELS